MYQTKFAFALFFLALLTGCASSVQNIPKARAISNDEASAFERDLQAIPSQVSMEPEPPIYIQPVNKKEPCKLPTTQDQLNRNNFRAYWDGQCKGGYAFGLGRDIAISDTHHVEEITIHNGMGYNPDSPKILYDFVNNKVMYLTPRGKYPAASWLREDIWSSKNNFFVLFSLGATDESGNNFVMEHSPLRPYRVFLNDRRNIIFRFTDNSAMPVIDASTVAFLAETLDPKTRTAGGVAIVRYGSGMVRHIKINGSSREEVTLPTEYVTSLTDILKSTQDALTVAQANLENARQLEREYLYFACGGKHVINGLDNETATKICTWRNQFKESYEKSHEKYTQDMKKMLQQADATKQQQLAQQEIDLQQRRLQQQHTQQEIQQLTNALGQFSQQMQNSSQQTLNSFINQPAPQVNFSPLKSINGNQIRCANIGLITNCRY